MILLTEYHASSIRLRRVILLRSDIRLMPSDIRCASCEANRISLKPQGFNITIAIAIISLFAKAKNITKSRKRESKAVFLSALFSLYVFIAQVSHLFNKCIGLCPYPYYKFSDKDITHYDIWVFWGWHPNWMHNMCCVTDLDARIYQMSLF